MRATIVPWAIIRTEAPRAVVSIMAKFCLWGVS